LGESENAVMWYFNLSCDSFLNGGRAAVVQVKATYDDMILMLQRSC